MNKSELVDQVADRAGLGRRDAAGAGEAALEAIERELAAAGEATITGFGKFSVAERRARRATRGSANRWRYRPAGRRASRPAPSSSRPLPASRATARRA